MTLAECIFLSTLVPVRTAAENVRGRTRSMGQFRIGLTLLAPDGRSSTTVEALVDTGAAYTVIPRPALESLGCRPVRTQRVVLADGRIEEWAVTHVDVECEGRRSTTPVLMSPTAGPALLGATTLEELGLGIDPLNRRLIPIDLYLASSHV
jgi:clan AA aspartic protease